MVKTKQTSTNIADITKQIGSYKQLVENSLQEYFTNHEEQNFITENSKKVFENLTEFTLRDGKRLRPALIYYGYKLFSGKDNPELIKLTTFMELIQSFLLIHDDIMDESDFRRGKPTIHKIYEKFAAQQKFSKTKLFGTSMAIIVGDLANQLAFEIILDAPIPDKQKIKLMKLIISEIKYVIYGQTEDIILGAQKNYNEDDVTRIQINKTAAYTFKLPLMIGALLADASKEAIKSIKEYSIAAGVAFQIRDDVIGIFNDEEITGKPNMDDVIEAKKTLLTFYAYRNATPKQQKILDECLGNPDLNHRQFSRFKQVLLDTGALKKSQEKCRQFINKACKAISGINYIDTTSFHLFNNIALSLSIDDL